MMILLWVVLLPFFMWVWWGFAFVIAKALIAIVTFRVTHFKETPMEDYNKAPARLIRYVDGFDHPLVLSRYDATKNLQCINKELACILPDSMRNRLEMSTIPETVIVDDMMGLRFGARQ